MRHNDLAGEHPRDKGPVQEVDTYLEHNVGRPQGRPIFYIKIDTDWVLTLKLLEGAYSLQRPQPRQIVGGQGRDETKDRRLRKAR